MLHQAMVFGESMRVSWFERSKDVGTYIICVVDYIFFIKANVTMDVNANEVRDVKWVTPEELRAMFADPGKVGIMRGEKKKKEEE